MSESTGRKMGPRETALLANVRSLVESGKELDAKGEPPWFYYDKAANSLRELPKARLADALEDVLDRLDVAFITLESIRSGPCDRVEYDRLRAVLAEVDGG